MKPVPEAEVTFTVECHEEDRQVKGNALSSGDEAEDRKAEDWVFDQLFRGNQWAWCTVIVKAKWKRFEGRSVLGCCSYKSEKEFMEDHYEEMKADALDDLNQKVESYLNDLKELL